MFRGLGCVAVSASEPMTPKLSFYRSKNRFQENNEDARKEELNVKSRDWNDWIGRPRSRVAFCTNALNVLCNIS